MPITLPALCLVTLVLCNIHGSLEHEIPKRSFLSRRAIDGTRGRKFFDPEEEGTFDSYGSAGGQYDPYQEKTDFSDIRKNVPGEPGIDYPAYTTLPQTGFTCEGRSRGYYADEVAGCQVFHVCHDVLVSSFLCPIGSTFSQKLLTCDWWTKVDCSSSSKYIGVNRNSYQQDDDEMIRNAYAMISLQSGTDVTKDGLVDPDRTGSIVDYQRGTGRILDYSPVDTTGNDLRVNFEDYPRPASRDFLPPYQLKDRKPETSRSYQGKFYPGDKSRSPYEDSPIIRVQKINDPGYGDQQRNRDFHETYRRPNEFTNQFQPSYAPTVPTVTTTTRRFYSPTVPTTFRPSTLAYNKLDQVIDSSDYYFSHSRTKSFVTPPTRAFTSHDKGGQNLGGGLRKPETVVSTKFNRDDDYSRQESYEDDYEDINSEEARSGRSRERFQVRVADDFNFNRTRLLNGRSSLFDGVYRGFDRVRDEEEIVDDFETRGSIGLGHALHQLRGISVQEQNPVKDKTKSEEINSHKEELKHTLVKPESTDYFEETREETTEQYQRNDQRGNETEKEIFDESDIFATTPSVIESTIKASTVTVSTNLSESLNSSILNDPGRLKNSTDANSEFLNGKDSIDRIDDGFQTFRPTEFLKSPQKTQTKFQIKVPDLSEVSTLLIRYTTLDNGPYGTRTTELPRFRNTYSDDYIDQPTSFDGNFGVTSNYGNAELSSGPSFQNYPTTVARPLVSSTGSWYSSSSPGPLDIKSPPSDYSDSSNDFTGPEENKSSNRHQSNPSFNSKNDKNGFEEKIANNHKSDLHFASDDSVRSTKMASVSGATASTPKTIKTASSAGALDSTESTLINRTFEKSLTQSLNNASSFFATKFVGVESSEPTSKPVTHRSTDEPSKKSEEKPEGEKDATESSTANTLLKSIRPETLKQIEETIEKNNSPYQVTLTVNQGEELIPTGGDLISKLIAQQGKETSTVSDKVHELEIVKSVEPEIHGTTESQTTGVKIVDNTDRSNSGNNFSNVKPQNQKRKSINTISLLQLMSELLKLDRIPRPFSLSDNHGSELKTRSYILRDLLSTTSSRTVAKHANTELQNEATTRSQESSTESIPKTSVPRSKEEILGQLEENFGEPLYGTQRKSIFDLPEKDRSVDFETRLPLRSTKRYEESSSVETTESTIVQTSYTASSRPSTTTTTMSTPSTPKTVLTTEPAKTVVKTEFVPSIGFSFDTDEGRDEYVEAVLGGLIEPHAAESEKKERILKEKGEEATFLKKNETLEKI